MDKIKKIIKRIISESLPNTNTNGKFEVGDVQSDRGIESTVTDIDSETGRISWDINYLPDFEELFTNATDLVNTAKGVYTKTKTDTKLRLIYDEARALKNTIRTHIRNEYPSEYKKITMNEDENLEEMSTTGGGAGAASFTPGTGMTYATPYAFRKPKKKQKAIKENLDLNAYGYKLVPKDKDGNYVQKGSKLDVVNIFEDQDEFQNKRIAAFDTIEQEMNDIYKMLSNAKNETSEYYNDNPSSYTVIKPTDLVLDYIKDIKNLLKGE
jgi:hypothetical protein|tara:strand:- start:686 stop:1489 length:804 start_codon:yes stop_codon:yes gene_type:complete